MCSKTCSFNPFVPNAPFLYPLKTSENLAVEKIEKEVEKILLKFFPGSKAKQLKHHTIPRLEEHQYVSTTIHVGIHALLKGTLNVSVDSICNDIVESALRCRNHNLGKLFISSIAYGTKANSDLIQQVNRQLYTTCLEYDYDLVDNGAVLKRDLWTDGIHLLESGKTMIAKNFISSSNYF